MIYDRLINQIEYERMCKNIIIVFNNIIEEDVHAIRKLNKKGKLIVDLTIRTAEDGGRSGNTINHAPSVKILYNNMEIPLYITKNKNTGDIICEIDKKSPYKNQLEHEKIYKEAKKFIENNGIDLIDLWKTVEGSDKYNDILDKIKDNNPQYTYQML